MGRGRVVRSGGGRDEVEGLTLTNEVIGEELGWNGHSREAGAVDWGYDQVRRKSSLDFADNSKLIVLEFFFDSSFGSLASLSSSLVRTITLRKSGDLVVQLRNTSRMIRKEPSGIGLE